MAIHNLNGVHLMYTFTCTSRAMFRVTFRIQRNLNVDIKYKLEQEATFI